MDLRWQLFCRLKFVLEEPKMLLSLTFNFLVFLYLEPINAVCTYVHVLSAVTCPWLD